MSVTFSSVRSVTRRPVRPQELLRRGFQGAHACTQTLAALGASSETGRIYPSALAAHTTVDLSLREAVRLAMKHPTPQTLKDAFDATDKVLANAKRATRSMTVSGSADLGTWSLAMAGLRAALEDIEQGLEHIVLLPSLASDYPEED